MTSTPVRGHTYQRAGSVKSGPAERRRRSLRVFTICALLAVAAAVLYGYSVGRPQPDAGAVNGVLDAFDDTVETMQSAAVTIDVDTNDTGEPDVASYAVVDQPEHGVLGAFDPTTAEIAYTPAAGYVGADSFTYSVDEVPGVPFDESALTTGAGGLGPGALDPDWTTSGTLGGDRSAATGHPAPGAAWATDPFAAGGWICSQACDDTGPLFFHRRFQIVDQATADGLAVALDLYASDELTEVYVNGIAVSGSSTGDTTCSGCGLSIVLRSSDPAFDFVVGTNMISIAISGDGNGLIGLMATPGTGDADGDGVVDNADRCVTPAASTVNTDGCRREVATVSIMVLDPTHLAGGICGQPVNGSFEDPVIGKNWSYVNDDDVAGWTSTTNWMEFWSAGMQGIMPVDGHQFAELNAKRYSTIYQDVPTTPGETISWRFSHQGRTGVDVMRLIIGASTDTAEPTLVMQVEASTGQAWSSYAGDYVVPAGQTSTRFAFANVSSANGRAPYGNLIDDFAFTARCVAPPPTTTATVPPTTTAVPGTSTTVPPTTTAVPGTTTTTTIVPGTTLVPTTTVGVGVSGGGPDTDGDGIADVDDPTPLLDAHIEFDGVERTRGETHDQLSYQLLLGNHGPADAEATVIAITPPDGTLITDWEFGSWTVTRSDAGTGTASGGLFGLGSAAEPVCRLDAFVLRCEMGTVASGWGMAFVVDMTVYDDPGVLDARATVVAMGFDVDLDNNADQLAVGSGPSLISSIPDALAFTGARFGMMWWLGGAVALISLGGGLMLFGARRHDDAY